MPRLRPNSPVRDREERRDNPTSSDPAPIALAKANYVASVGQAAIGVPVTHNTVMGIAAFRNGVALISEGVAGTPLFPAIRGEGGGFTPATDHPCFDLLTHAPNAYTTAFDFWSSMMVNALVDGIGLATISRWDDDVSGFHLLPSGYKPKVEEGRVVYKRGNDTIDAADCIAIRGLSSDGFNLLSPTEANRDVLGTTLAENRHQQSLLANGATPQGHIETSGPQYNTTEQRGKLRDDWKARHGGPNNAGEVGILHNAKWVNTTLSPIDMQILESKGFGVGEVARILNIALWMLGTPGAEPPSSTEEGLTQFVQITLRPWFYRIQQELSLKLLSPVERKTICFRHDDLSLARGDNRTKIETVEKMVRSGIWTLNEGRKFLGYNPVDLPQADELAMQTNNLQFISTIPIGGSTQPAASRPSTPLPQSPSDDDQ